jgi:hypothetical protein
VVNSSLSKVYKFKFAPASLIAFEDDVRQHWLSNSAAMFKVRYNGVEQVCDISGSATITTPAGSTSSFVVKGRLAGVGSQLTSLKMPMTAHQKSRIRTVWDGGKLIGVKATFVGRCEDGTVLRPAPLDSKM